MGLQEAITNVLPSFVGRDWEVNFFEEMLWGKIPQRAFYLWGDGGLGKTWLLKRLLVEAQGAFGYVVPGSLIDFYSIDNRRTSGLRRSVIQLLGEEHFDDFLAAEAEFNEERSKEAPSEAMVDALRQKADEQFFLDCEQFAMNQGSRMLLAFDTFELVQKDKVGRWFLDEFIPRLEHYVIIFAGRGELPGTAIMKTHHLGGFTERETQAFFERKGMKVNPSDLQAIWTRTEGRPILLDLVIDWSSVGVAAVGEWTIVEKRQFESQLVNRIRKLELPLNQTVLWMAHFFRRFDKEILQFLIDRKLTPIEASQIDATIEQLSEFSFVKYRPDMGSCLLHDEMQRLVVQHVWTSLDPAGEIRAEASRAVEQYYEGKITSETDDVARQDLIVERIGYVLDFDLRRGYDLFIHHFDEAMGGNQFGFAELLLGEIGRVETKLSPDDQYEIANRRADWFYSVSDFEQATREYQAMLDHYADGDEREASTLSRLAHCAIRQGKMKDAINYLERALQIAKARQRTEWQAAIEHSLGFAHRLIGDWDRALEYYEESLQHAAAAGDSELLARVYNDSGFIYALRGEYSRALQRCQRALKIREILDDPKAVGYSHSALGEVLRYSGDYRSAFEHYGIAFKIFQEYGDKEWLGMLYQQRGIANFMVGRKLEGLGNLSKARGYYESAFEDLKAGLDICTRYSFIKDMPSALHRLAHVYEAQGDLNQAERLFKQSVTRAEETDQYHIALDSLVELARVKLEREKYQEVIEHARQLEKLKGAGYQRPLFSGMMEITLGDLACDREKYEEALERWCNGFSLVAEDKGYGLYLLPRRMDALLKRLEKMPADESIRCAQRLQMCWDGKGLREFHPEMFDAVEGHLLAMLARRAKKERPDEQHSPIDQL